MRSIANTAILFFISGVRLEKYNFIHPVNQSVPEAVI
jgi:hypothetical protein